MYFFKTSITMHLVRTFKTVDLFKVPLCEGNFLRMDGMIEGLEKKVMMSELEVVNWHIQ